MAADSLPGATEAVERRGLTLALGVLALYMAPLVVLGQDATVLIHDNLDSNVLWYRILAESGLIFAANDAIVPNLLGGLPRATFGSEWNLQLWLYVWLEPYPAYVVNQLLMRLAALVGTFWLLRDHVLRGADPRSAIVAVGCALCFALLPFWPSGGLSIAGQPLALNAFLNVRRGAGRAADWAVVGLLPFYSCLVLANCFFVAALGVFAGVDALRTRRLNLPFLGALALHGGLLLAVEYRLLLAMFSGGGFVSHRIEFAPALKDGTGALAAFWKVLRNGQYHASSLHAPVIAAAVAIAALLARGRRDLLRPLLACVGGVLALAVFYGLFRWQGFASGRAALSLGIGFNADRFYTLLPLLTIVAFALSLRIVCERFERGRWFAGAFVGLQVALLFVHSDFAEEQLEHGISFRAFFAREQFAAIAEEIGLPQERYRVACIGLHPSIAQFNGFHTVGGYFPNYPLRHKHALRGVMRHELAKDPELARYFDDWGSRAYVFSSELGKNSLNPGADPKLLRDLELDPTALDAVDVRFVLSAAEIASPERSGLAERRVFRHEDSAWHVYLYERASTPELPLSASHP